jgi:hypothetical protein
MSVIWNQFFTCRESKPGRLIPGRGIISTAAGALALVLTFPPGCVKCQEPMVRWRAWGLRRITTPVREAWSMTGRLLRAAVIAGVGAIAVSHRKRVTGLGVQ